MVKTAVIGAGILGLATALRLQRAGHDVTVFDPAPVSGASYAAAGMLAPVAEVQFGQDSLLPIMQKALDEYPEFLELLGVPHEAVGYETAGTLLVAADPGDREHLERMERAYGERGLAFKHLPGSRLARLEPALAPGLSAGAEIPGDLRIDPRRFTNAMLEALGPEALVRQRVTRLDGATLHTADGVLHSFDTTVVAAGMEIADIAGLPEDSALNLRPVYGDVIRVRVPESRLRFGPLLSRTVRAVVTGRSVYVVPRASGEIVIGASVREDRPDTDLGSVADLLADAITVVPGLRDCDLIDVTTRARPTTEDDMPVVTRTQVSGTSAVVVAGGLSRHGILLTPYISRLAAQAADTHPEGRIP